MFCIDMGKLTNLYQLEKSGFDYPSRDDMIEMHEKIDFNFHCIRDIEQNNKIIIQYCTRMSDGVRRQKAYCVNFEKLVYSISKFEEYEDNFPKPKIFGKAVNIAHYLSRGFGYIRVNSYVIEDQVCFGEYTPCRTIGIAKVASEQHDYLLSKHWHCKEISFEPSGDIRK